MTPDDVDIRDIAHSLALTNRFTGHTPSPYSVAQHSVVVSKLCPQEHALWGLLHDAPEAYLADISRPVKQALLDRGVTILKEIDKAIMAVVAKAFGLRMPEPPEVKRADDNALANEAYAFFGHTEAYKSWHHQFDNGYDQMPERISPQRWQYAEHNFLVTFNNLTGGKFDVWR